MKTKPLGKTGYTISVMGYGCGGFWGYEIFNEKTASRLVHMALDGGVNFIDTGSSYSGGNAEKRLGRILKGVDKSRLIIGTKAGTVIRDGRPVKDYSSASITRQVESSLKNLGLESLPLLQLHGVPMHGIDEALDTLGTLKQQGKIKLAGASCDGAALEYALSFDRLDVVMLTYNLIVKQAIKQIELAYSKGCGILVKSPLAHTLYGNEIFMTRKMSDIWYFLRAVKNNRSQFLEGRKYRFINHIKGWAANEIALLYALQDKVSCVVTGTTDVIHMKRNINTFEKEFPQDIKQMIDAV